MDYFTERHFELLGEWQGRRCDNSNPEHKAVYDELKVAYAVTEEWADQVKERLFPAGKVEVIKRPTNQANNFTEYTWAKIYPYEHAANYLAYTVGISAAYGFIVKIDTALPNNRGPVRQAYERLYGGYGDSPIVSFLPRAEGLPKTLPELVEWTVGAFQGFSSSYDNVWAELDKSWVLGDEELLAHFDGKPAFAEFRANWMPEETALFCRLARAMHDAGMDWWHIGSGTQVSCGRRNPGAGVAVGALAYVQGRQARTIRFNILFGEFHLGRQPLTEDLVRQIETCLAERPSFLKEWETERPGLWPDQLQSEAASSDEGDEEEEPEVVEARPRKPLNTILFGPPGTGKTYATVTRCLEICDNKTPAEPDEVRARYGQLLDEDRIEFVTFHQSYGYEEFVEGIRPAAGPNDTGGVRLRVKAGVLKRIAKRARKASGINAGAGAQPHVLVIDEINRANISRVMGELITLLEEDKRDGAENEVAVTLPYSGERFTLPANLHILGTMNTADRSIAVLDTALRRRFHFEEMCPEPELLKDTRERTGVDLPAVLRAMNQRLEYLVDRDHLIGHAWFMDAKTRDDVDAVMRHKIIPLIAEYFYDDWSKVRAVLGGTDHFVERHRLPVPPELGNGIGEERYGWTVRAGFPEDAYEVLVGTVDPPGGA